MCFKEYTKYETAADGSSTYQSLCRGSLGNSNKQKDCVVSGFVATCGGWEKEEVEVIPILSPSNKNGVMGRGRSRIRRETDRKDEEG